MSTTLDDQIEQLKNTIAGMESQRGSLGDAVVEAALAPLQRRLDELTALLAAREEQPAAEPAQQRKLVTLLFMDIAGSTAIAQHMDPEDVRDIFDSVLEKLAVPVEEHGGRVTRFMGDGFLSVFGAPLAREDAPELAIRAGLQIIELSHALAHDLQEQWNIPDFQVRVGINTGLVALGGQTEAEHTLMGAAVNLAARLENAAPPGGLLISHDTYQHVRGVFNVELMEPISAKGFDQPVPVYRVLSAKPRAFRLYTRGVEGIETHMVGRETELKYLQDALLTAIEEGEGQMVTITGEAGVGKSRLLYEFQDWIELQPPPAVRFFEGRGRQEAQGLPSALLRDLFAFRFQIQDDDSGEAVSQKIESGFAEVFGSDPEGEMRAHILGQWLGFDFNISPHLKGVLADAEQLRNRGLMYLGEYFRGLSIRVPVVVFLEDLHWVDTSSLDALNWLGERMRRQRLLVVCTARSTLFERRPYWGEGLAYHRCISLEPLSRRESRQLVADILRLAQEIPPELRELVVEGAEGNPFYLEELIKMLVEGGVILKGEETWRIEPSRLSEIQVPPTLAGVLQARLDSLPLQERTVLQQASVVGRQFWDRIVAYIQSAEGGGKEIVPQALTALRERELIYHREVSAFAEASEYIFKNDILREVTYESVLKRLRRRYHGLVADWLIAQGAGWTGEYYGVIADHLLQAGKEDQASQYFIQAGESALASFANGEAEAHFRKALEYAAGVSLRAACLAGLGETLGRLGMRQEADQSIRQAIDLYLELGEYELVAHVYTRLAQILWLEDYQKAWDACQEGLERLQGAADSPGLATLLAEAGRDAFYRAQPEEIVTSLCTQAIAMAERLQIVEPSLHASITLAVARGDPQSGINSLEEAVASSEARGLLRTASRAYHNLGYFCYVSLAGANQTFQYYLKSAEINRQIGDIGGTIFSLTNAIYHKIFGHLQTMEDHGVEFLYQASATEAQVKDYLHRVDVYLSVYKGDWDQALGLSRARLEWLRKGGSLHFIARENESLASTILELDRFTGQDTLGEAEAALQENIDFHWEVIGSRLIQSIVSTRRGLFQEARERLAEAAQTPAQQLSKIDEAHQIRARAELAQAEQHWDEAISHWQTLIDMYQASGYRWFWARHLIDLGDALLDRNAPGDPDKTKQVYQQSLEMFTEMGAPGYVRVLEERLGRL